MTRSTSAGIRSVVEATNPAWPKDPAPPIGLAAAWATPPSPPAPPPAPKPAPAPTGPVLANNPAPAPSSPNGTMAGFDTCTAPSLPTMKAWRAKCSATAIYIGGQMMSCG